MLQLEDQILDATTEEGQAALKEFEEQNRLDALQAAEESKQATAPGHTSDPE